MSASLSRDLGESIRQEERLLGRTYARESAVGEDFSGLDCAQVVFQGCRLAGTDFSGSFFDHVRWERCDLSGCRFS